MRLIPCVLIAACVLVPLQAMAQQQPPAPAPIKPYKAVAVSLPQQTPDPSLDAFREAVAKAAEKKDRAALGKLVVAKGFFWENGNGDGGNPKKSSLDNLLAAFELEGKDAAGWEALGGMASEPTASPDADHQGVVCAPASPNLDDKAFEELTKTTGTDPAEWGYPTAAGVEVHKASDDKSPVIEKLGSNLVRLLPPEQAEAAPAQGAPQNDFVRVATPTGKTGYAHGDTLRTLVTDELCYVKEAGGWRIAGVIGGGNSQQ